MFIRPRLRFLRFCLLRLCLLPLHASITPVRAEEAVPLGVLIPLSGQFAELGDQCRWGVELARTSSPPPGSLRTVAFTYEDSQAEPKVAVSGFRRLVDDKKVVSVITIRSPVGLAINPLSLQTRVPVLGAVAMPQFVERNLYAFQMWPSPVAEGAVIADGVLRYAGKRAAIVTAEDDWLLAFSQRFRERFEEQGGTVVLDESVRPADPDLSATLTKVRSAGVDAVFLDLTVAQIGIAVKKLHELGYTKKIFSNFWAALPDVGKSAGKNGMNGVFFSEINLQHPNFLSGVEKLFPGKRPTAATFSCYTSTVNVLTAIYASTAPVTNESVYKNLISQPSISILDGAFAIRDRIGQYDVALKVIRNGKVEVQ